MNTSSLNGFSSNYIEATLANQLTSNSLSSSKQAKGSQQSEFSKMLDDLSANTKTPITGNPGQTLSHLVSNFQLNGIAGQGQSFDPNSIGM